MLVTIERKEFDTLNGTALIWVCVEPTIQKIRGKNFSVKSEVYSQLTAGQQALLMFQILYGHTLHGIEEFYSHLSYLLSNKGMWSQLKNGMRYFGADDMVRLLDEMNTFYGNLRTEEFREEEEQRNERFDEIERDAALMSSLSRLDAALKDVLPSTVGLVSSYIRNHPEQFLRFSDEKDNCEVGRNMPL